MEENKVPRKIFNILRLDGHFEEEIARIINGTEYSRRNNYDLNAESLTNDTSVDDIVKEYKGLAAWKDMLAEIVSDPRYFKAMAELNNERELLFAGWKIFRNVRWMSWLYLTILTSLVLLIHFYVAPNFESFFSMYDADLPELTKYYFTEGQSAIYALAVVWLVAVIYLLIISRVKKYIKQYRQLPKLFCHVPMLGRVLLSLQCSIELSKLKFVDIFSDLPSAQLQHKHLVSSIETDIDHLELAKELNIGAAYIQAHLDECMDRYIDSATLSMRRISLLGTTILATFIGLTVLSIYLPIFMMGAMV